MHQQAERHQHNEQARAEEQPRHRFGGVHAHQCEAKGRGLNLRIQQAVDGVHPIRVTQLDHDAHDEEEDQHQTHPARDRIVRALAEGLKNELQRQAKQGDQQPNEEPEELVATVLP